MEEVAINTLENNLNEELPVNLAKGNVIKSGVSDELDRLRGLQNSGKEYLDEMCQREIERTGIASLKINFNNVFGYYIEVRNTHKDKVPEEWIRKQTLVNAEIHYNRAEGIRRPNFRSRRAYSHSRARDL